jgi:hypothetical protein
VLSGLLGLLTGLLIELLLASLLDLLLGWLIALLIALLLGLLIVLLIFWLLGFLIGLLIGSVIIIGLALILFRIRRVIALLNDCSQLQVRSIVSIPSGTSELQGPRPSNPISSSVMIMLELSDVVFEKVPQTIIKRFVFMAFLQSVEDSLDSRSLVEACLEGFLQLFVPYRDLSGGTGGTGNSCHECIEVLARIFKAELGWPESSQR